MKALFLNIWKYLAIFFAGAITAFVYAMKQMQPDQTNIKANNYVANQEQHIGKLKQRGEGNTQTSIQAPELSERKLKRIERRTKRKARRQDKEQSDTNDQEQQETG